MTTKTKTTTKAPETDLKASLFDGIKGGELAKVNGVGSLANHKMPDGFVTLQSIIPMPVQNLMQNQFAAAGLNFDISQLALGKDDMRSTLNRLRETVELISNNASLLPEFKKALLEIMQAGKKMAKFNSEIACAGLSAQLKIDKAHAKVLMGMTGYVDKRNQIDAKVEAHRTQVNAQSEARKALLEVTHGKQLNFIQEHKAAMVRVIEKKDESKLDKLTKETDRKIAREDWKQVAH